MTHHQNLSITHKPKRPHATSTTESITKHESLPLERLDHRVHQSRIVELGHVTWALTRDR
jgi:hypothetical protein